MISPRGEWIFFKVKVKVSDFKIMSFNMLVEKEDVKVLAIGPDVKFIKVGQRIIVRGHDVQIHGEGRCEGKIEELDGFVREENVLAIVE